MTAAITAFFDEATATISYVVADTVTKICAVIDPVLDYEPSTATITKKSVERIIEFIHEEQLQVVWLLETHVHADHLSASAWLQEKLGGAIAIGERVTQVQQIFGKLFNVGDEFARDGRQFNRLLRDGDELALGQSIIRVIHTPGHTPACMTFLIDDAAFIGDTLFMPDYGTARCDFPGGDARALYHSIQRIYALPDATRLFLCHDYLPEASADGHKADSHKTESPQKARAEHCWQTSVAEQKQHNISANAAIGESTFVTQRNARDAQLPKPKLLLPSIQINMRAGHYPPAENNGVRYLKLPITVR